METNSNARLEAFCDGVFAIALTLLIIDIRIPGSIEIDSAASLWIAVRNISPSIFAFLLSFTIIFITWMNHHATLKLVTGSSSSFVYANALLLLSVVFIPFPTALLGEYLLTGYSSPAVVLYNAVLALQAIGWISLTATALNSRLTQDEKSTAAMRINRRNGYFALVVYSMFAIIAFWLPQAIAVLTTLTWIFWLIHGVRIAKPHR